MNKVEVDVQPLLDRIKWVLRNELHAIDVRQYKGQNKKEGHVLLSFGLSDISAERMRIDIDIDVIEALKSPEAYFDGIYEKIYYTYQAALAKRQERTRIN